MEEWALIVAGGSGQRMGADIPKQFMLLRDKPILMHTLQRFAKRHIVLVLPDTQVQYWKGLCKAYDCGIEHTIVVGGATRTESVINGLSHIPDGTLVAIHDGVRPLLTEQLIDTCFHDAALYGSAIPAIASADSVRLQGRAIDREQLQLIQTPQTFQTDLIRRAYDSLRLHETNSTTTFTDDATVYETLGKEPHLVKGEKRNIKITLPIDIKIAEALL